jgi:hypothetical protein
MGIYCDIPLLMGNRLAYWYMGKRSENIGVYGIASVAHSIW